MKEELNFWYESNACWGRVQSISKLVEMLRFQIEENNGINTIGDFLDSSLQKGKEDEFGTRIEHKGPLTLRKYLSEKGYLKELLEAVNQ